MFKSQQTTGMPFLEPLFDPSPLFLWVYILIVAFGYYIWYTRISPSLASLFALPGTSVPACAGAAYHTTTFDPPPPQRAQAAQQPKYLNLRDFGPLGIDQTDLARLKRTKGTTPRIFVVLAARALSTTS